MHNSDIGVLGEALVLAQFATEGYEIYTPFGGKTKHDMIVEKDSVIYRVQVKTTTSTTPQGRYIVQLKSVRSNKNKNTIHRFDNTSCDLLAVVIVPEKRVLLIPAASITSTCSLVLN